MSLDFLEDVANTIQRCPHDKENPYAQISRELIRDESISPNCRWLIMYFLSMKDGWRINIAQLVNHLKGHIGRNKVYRVLNEAIEAGYIRKETLKNPDNPNLKGKILYWVSESPKFKKCFRHSDFEYTEAQHPENEYIKKEHQSSEEDLSKERSSSKKKATDDDLVFTDKEREQLKNFSSEQIKEATKITQENCLQSKNSVRVKYFLTTIRNLKEKPKNTKISPFEELSKKFKKGQFYNKAECNITEKAIAFTRGMKHEEVDFKYFSWDKFQQICQDFGIEFERSFK